MEHAQRREGGIHHVSSLGRWEVYDRAPSPALRAFVRRCGGFDERTPDPMRRRQVASSQVVWVIDLTRTLRTRVGDEGWSRPASGFVAGLQPSLVRTEHAGVSRGIIVSFTALGGRRFFGPALRELAGRVVGTHELWGRESEELAERLDAAPTWASRLTIVEELVTRRVLAGASYAPSPLIEVALRRLEEQHGRLAIDALARGLGCTRKHLHASFREHLGMAPKIFARLVRFQQLVGQVQHPASKLEPWSRFARQAGYADQAHMIRECRAFSGASPDELRRRQRPDGGGLIDD